MFIIHDLLSKPCNIINSNIYSLSLFRPSVHYLRTIVCFTGLSDCFVMPFCTLRPNLFCSAAKEGKSAVLNLLLAHRVSPFVLCTSRLNLFAPRTRFTSFAPSVRKSAVLDFYVSGFLKRKPFTWALSSIRARQNPLSWIFTFRAS